MGIIRRPTEKKVEKDRDLMGEYMVAILDDIDAAAEQSSINKPFQMLEKIIFAMFMVTDYYSGIKGRTLEVDTCLESFHGVMRDNVTNELFLKSAETSEIDDVEKYQEFFSSLLTERYMKYREKRDQDFLEKSMLFRNMNGYFLDNAQVQPLSDMEKKTMVVNLSIIEAHFLELMKKNL